MEIPGRSIITQLYVGYPTYQRIPKPEKYKTFFILRDPRDIVVSWYFSTRYSHKPVSYVPEYRKRLEKMDLKEGLKFTIDVMNLGIFPIQRSWMSGAVHDRNAAIFRFEDFAEDNQKFLAEIFDYLEISLTENERNELTERYAFKKLTRGRSQGAEDRMSHFRKGIAGDWQNYFDASITNYFNRVAGGLLEQLGYRELDS
ncbi:MAG: sulfotransferase domain-containing protein [Gammaproteobacteria bacterium]